MNEFQPAWYCIRTMHKHEHVAYANLRKIEGVEAFYPRLRSPHRVRGRIGSCIEPLFPCYLFARFTLNPVLDVVRYTYGVQRVVNFSTYWPTIPDEEIQILKSEFGADEVLERPAPQLEPGTVVDVTRGPFEGMRAVVKYHMPAAQRVKILIELLAQQTLVDTDIGNLSVHQSYPNAVLA